MAVVGGLIHLGGCEVGGGFFGGRAGQHGAGVGIVEDAVALFYGVAGGIAGSEFGGGPIGVAGAISHSHSKSPIA